MTTYTGKVKWFNAAKGFGFLKGDTDIPGTEEGEHKNEVFCHFSAIQTSSGFKTLDASAQVQFEVKRTEKGLMAVNVIPL